MTQEIPASTLSDNQSSTVVGGWSVAVGRALNALGFNGEALLLQAGIDRERLMDADSRISSENTRKLWSLALTTTQQEDIGLQVANYVCPTTFHALGFSLWASNSLEDALKRMVRFETLLNDGCHLRCESAEPGQTLFSMEIRQCKNTDLIAYEGVDYFLGAVVKMFRDMSDQRFAPLSVHLTRPCPENPDLWTRFFNCPVLFQQAENALILDQQCLATPLPTGNPILAEQNDKLVEDYLQRLQLADLTSEVRSVLIDLMPLGLTTLEEVAAKMNVVPRTLQYQLNQNGTTIQQLRDQLREELARNYLQHSRQSITQIAYSLGFSDPAHLNRAFKRWTGETPTAYRNQFL